jgi:Coenzyme PQQ synthesis protein D (PqqD)
MISHQISVNDRIRSNNQLPGAEIHNEVLLMNQEKGLFYVLDDIGSAIFRMIATPTCVSELCDRLSIEYGAEPAVVQRDVLNLLDAMSTHGLIAVMDATTT